MRRFMRLFLFLTAVMCIKIHAEARPEYSVVYGEAQFDALTITSFSSSWTEGQLKDIYTELLNNAHGAELGSLSHIYLYPDSPEGIKGSYYEDLIESEAGLALGSGAYIELFDMDKINNITEIAFALSHEYGHHYTIYNISRFEGRYYPDWQDTCYARLRSLSDYPINYAAVQSDNPEHVWDITEIAACDYTALLGSPLARASYKYQDVEEKVFVQLKHDMPRGRYFNGYPQENLHIPLAAEVDGLYSYLAAFAHINGEGPIKPVPPVITEITAHKSNPHDMYVLTFIPAVSNNPNENFEYTAVMYPSNRHDLIKPIKTLYSGDNPYAVFGAAVNETEDGFIYGTNDYYEGEYVFKVFVKDSSGFIYSSDPALYNFGSPER